MTKDLPSPELLRKLLRYEPETGRLFWLQRPSSMFSAARYAKSWNARYAGKEALTADNGDGYLRGNINSRLCLAHRVAWAMFYGAWNAAETDHINGVRSDNRIENLRSVSTKMNQRNVKIKTSNTSGHCGVSKNKMTGKWVAHITVDRAALHLGYHNCITSAIIARRLAEQGLGFTERHGT